VAAMRLGRVGTPRYMAPELVMNTAYNAKVDVYSGSMVLWFMVIGQTPHQFMDGGAHRFFFYDVRII
jgi:serine/threonine protein kinase